MQEDETAPATPSAKGKSSVTNRERNKNPLHGPQTDVRGIPLLAGIGELRPNKWNYNTQSPAVFNKLVESMRRHGFTKRVITRRVPDVEGHEIIDGEHRWRAGQLLGVTHVPIEDLGEVPDAQAKELTILLNELGGRPDDVRLGDLLREINLLTPMEELAKVMPFSESEMDTYINAMSFDLASLSGEDTRPAEAKLERDAAPMKSSKKVVAVRWGGLAAYDVDLLLSEVRTTGGFASNEDAIVAALRVLNAKIKGTP